MKCTQIAVHGPKRLDSPFIDWKLILRSTSNKKRRFEKILDRQTRNSLKRSNLEGVCIRSCFCLSHFFSHVYRSSQTTEYLTPAVIEVVKEPRALYRDDCPEIDAGEHNVEYVYSGWSTVLSDWNTVLTDRSTVLTDRSTELNQVQCSITGVHS
jgi:hypothetical protein